MDGPVSIEVRGLRAGYDGRAVIDSVDVTVRSGELVALVGPNGAGKSTLLKVLVGILRPMAGTATVLGATAAPSGRRVAYLPQAEAVRWDYPLLIEDVAFMGRLAGTPAGRGPNAGDRAAVSAALARVELTELRRQPVSALSGGQRQRVLLARTLASEPEILLLDEPATGVDPTTEERLMAVLGELAAAGRTAIVATHDLAGVMAHFQRVVCMNGTIVADGGVEILRDDAVLRRTYGGHPTQAALVSAEHHA